MLLEDRLDVLLSTGDIPDATGDEAQLVPLLGAAGQLTPLRMTTPSPTFADKLYEQLLIRAAALRDGDTAGHANIYATTDIYTEPTLETVSPTASQPRAPRGKLEIRLPARRSAYWWPVAVAVMLCLLFGGVFLGSRVTPSLPTDQFHQHLISANHALQSYDDLVTAHANDAALAGALTTLLSEQQAATQSLSAVPSGSDHNALATQLADLRQRAQNDLLASLPSLDWTSRVRATAALGGLGKQVLTIFTVHISRDDDDSRNVPWRIQVQGSGFVSGAILLFGGQPGGKIISVTPTMMVATWTEGTPPKGVGVGVQNPDGTAAETTNVRFQSDD